MSIGPLASIACGFLQSIIGPALGKSGAADSKTAGSTSGAGATQADQGADYNQSSPFSQVLSTLQQLQQANPAQYQQVTRQISANLQSASNTAQANGNSAAATELDTLATDFKSASQSGQLPSVQDLAGAVTGHRHHAHASGAASEVRQMLASIETGGVQSGANPMSIIGRTLSSAGV
jgi:hypothetical protein